jgi:uncharacterized membrane protein YGL010W
MKSLQEQMAAYSGYHQNFWNKLTHFLGVPMVVFSLFVPLGWFRFDPMPEWPLTGATLFFLGTLIYYFRLDALVALMVIPITVTLLYFADLAAQLPFMESFTVFGATFVGGWVIQLIGHVIEGKRPALADNLMQIFNAPLFLNVEVLLFLGFRKDLRDYIEGSSN